MAINLSLFLLNHNAHYFVSSNKKLKIMIELYYYTCQSVQHFYQLNLSSC